MRVLRGSFIPPAEIKAARDVFRYRVKVVQSRTSEVQRLGAVLQDAGIKIDSVASSIATKSGRAPRHGVDHLPARPAIRKLAGDNGPLLMSLFDTQDLAEISHPDYPGERLIACHNPALAAERAAHRERLLSATEAELAKIKGITEAGRLTDPATIGVRAGKVINKRKVAKHFILDIGQGTFAWHRDQASIDAEAALDGIYVIRTPVPASQLPAPAAV